MGTIFTQPHILNGDSKPTRPVCQNVYPSWGQIERCQNLYTLNGVSLCQTHILDRDKNGHPDVNMHIITYEFPIPPPLSY